LKKPKAGGTTGRIDYGKARQLLEETVAEVEAKLIVGNRPAVDKRVREACEILFASKTQSTREALLGLALARIQDKEVNLRLPYAKQGPTAFNARDLDQAVVNPFFQDHHIPSSKGPYLAVYRRGIRFDETTKQGVRDPEAYDALLQMIAYLEKTVDAGTLHEFLCYLVYKFAELREASNVPVSRLQRISLEQYDALISALLARKSGGRFPVVLVVATFRAIKKFFKLDWAVAFQQINVADQASGAAGDVTISTGGKILMAVEITERRLERARVVSTFKTKIAPSGIEDYLFFVKDVDPDAKDQARLYFSQGHEVNFLEIKNWMLACLATMGKQGRAVFNSHLLEFIDDPGFPKSLKVSWNESIAQLVEDPQ
jgi:hypothetical protein